jgi:hypothetical protein
MDFSLFAQMDRRAYWNIFPGLHYGLCVRARAPLAIGASLSLMMRGRATGWLPVPAE